MPNNSNLIPNIIICFSGTQVYCSRRRQICGQEEGRQKCSHGTQSLQRRTDDVQGTFTMCDCFEFQLISKIQNKFNTCCAPGQARQQGRQSLRCQGLQDLVSSSSRSEIIFYFCESVPNCVVRHSKRFPHCHINVESLFAIIAQS